LWRWRVLIEMAGMSDGRATPRCSGSYRGNGTSRPARPLPALEPTAPTPSSQPAGRPAAEPSSMRAGPTDKGGHNQVADRDALQRRRKCAGAGDGSEESRCQKLPREQNDRAEHSVTCEFGPRIATPQPRLGRKHDRHTHQKKETWKNQVGGRQSVPRGVVHLSPCASPELFTMIMKAMVSPRSTSSESRRFEAPRQKAIGSFRSPSVRDCNDAQYPTGTDPSSPSEKLLPRRAKSIKRAHSSVGHADCNRVPG